MRKWKAEGWDIRGIFDFALAYHASYLNNKSAPVPEGPRGEVVRFLGRIGYRLVLRELEHDEDGSCRGIARAADALGERGGRAAVR